MKTWKIRLQAAQGGAVSWARCAARYVLAWVWFLPPLAFLSMVPRDTVTFVVLALFLPVVWIAFYSWLTRFLPQQQYLHDVLVGTRLERHAPEKPHRGLV